MSQYQEYKKTIQQLESEGWITEIGKKSLKLRHEKYGAVYCSLSPSCTYAHKHVLGDVRRKIKEYERRKK